MTDRLEVRLLGGVTFLLKGQPVKSLPTRASQALMIFLLHQNRPVERERLIDMFYQVSTPKQAAANFRSTLSRLRLLAMEGMQKQAAIYEQTGDYWAALHTINQLLAVEPLLEEAHRAKMMLLVRTGQRP
ncbi:BTAD domain-containing putative transcriptional regulator [Candidatus Leptofilum sp.]|uniref:BTAD domain-containing putative transcriptional regulator n=1 Tax=Candidatus Leptofilum sp. TaxID=3241576 RepID=UPI003B5C5511